MSQGYDIIIIIIITSMITRLFLTNTYSSREHGGTDINQIGHHFTSQLQVDK